MRRLVLGWVLLLVALTASADIRLITPGGGATGGASDLTVPTLYGTDTANGDLTLEATSHATKAASKITLQPTGGLVGIGTSSPLEKLHVDGAVVLGDAISTTDGTLRWTGTDFEGRKSGAWTSLTAPATTQYWSRASSSASLTQGLTAHWQLNETSGTRNAAHGVRHLTDNASVTSVTGKLSNAAHFNGTSQYLSHANHADLQTGNVDVTVAGWARWDSLTGTRALVSKGNLAVAAQFEYVVESVGTELRVYVADGSSEGMVAATSVTLTTGQWYFWVFWHDAAADTINVQVGNGTVHTTAWTTGLLASGSEFTIGRHSANPAAYFAGDLDSISLWKGRVLTSAERTALYNGGTGLDYPLTLAEPPLETAATMQPLGALDNLGVGMTMFGTNAARVLGLAHGTPPTTSPADAVQLYSADRAATAGKGSLLIRSEDGTSHLLGDRVGLGTTTPGEMLQVAGAVQLGNATGTADGTLRWTGSDFEGRKAGAWTSLTGAGIVQPWSRTAAVGSTLATGLVAHWELGEASGSRADSTANANTLVDNNTVTQATGLIGNAAQFVRTNSEWLSIADNANLSMGDIDFTIALWARWDTLAASQVLLSKGNGASGQMEYHLDTIGSTLFFRVYNGSSGASAQWSATLTTNTWYAIIAWHDSVANTINISVNNATPVSTAWSGGSYNSAYEFVLGRWANVSADYFNGRIDQVDIAKRVWTSAERTEYYNGGLGTAWPYTGTPAVVTTATTTDNVTIGLAMPGGSAERVLALGNGVAPLTSPADAVQLWSADRGATAGKGALHLRTEDGTSHVFGDRVGLGTTTPGEMLQVSGALILGTAVGTTDGTVRWTGADFEGRKDGAWTSLTGTGAAQHWARTNASSLSTNLSAHWELGEASGTRADSSGNANTLTDNNTVTQAVGIVGSAAQFTAASSEYLSIADNASLSMGDIDFTIAAWARWDTLSGTMILVSKGNANVGGQAMEYQLYSSGTSLIFSVGNGSTTTTVTWGTTLATNTWYAIIAWHDATANTINVVANGGTVASAAWTGGSHNSTYEFCLGRWANYNGGYFNGRLDQVDVAKRVWTSAERAAYYNGGGGVAWPYSVALLSPTALTDYVGIGTAAPTTMLHIAGGTLLAHKDGAANSTNQLILKNDDQTSGKSIRIDFQGNNAAGTNLNAGSILVTQSIYTAGNETADMRFLVRDAGANSERMRLTGTGLGIDRTTIDAALDVNGVIAITDGVGSPAATAGKAKLYVDSSGNFKIRYGDGTVKVIATNP
jgi:hypothetical protein